MSTASDVDTDKLTNPLVREEETELTGKGKVITLEAPGTGAMDTWRAMGPGIAAAMTGIGASHIMHGPTAGAQYEYALLWIIPFAYLMKYCAFEFAHRYTLVRGESIMEAYGRVGNWPFWYLGFQSLVNTFGIAGRALGCAALLWAAFPFMPLEIWALAVLVISVGILWAGKYAALEGAVKIAIIVFAGASLIAFLLQMPTPSEYMGRLLPTLPPIGAALLFGAMFGYFPTTVEVSAMQSNWAVDKKSGMVKVRELERQGYKVNLAPNYMRNYFTLFKRDMNISYVISMLTGIAFLIVGAVVLFPKGIVPEKAEMGTTIAFMYTETFGAWIFPIIIGGGVAALFSTVFTYFDGQARVFEECCVRLKTTWDEPRVRKLLYRGFQVLWVVAGAAIIYGLPRPIFVVQIASVLALLFSPVIYWLNIKAVKDNFTKDDAEFLPSKLLFAWAWIGTIGLGIISLYVLYLQFLS
ncbi:Nramp family divalent metal transporter [Paracoccus saliphilus]|uniref:Mn2+ and Fe2+ transporters of the NRAMP family n=1 Tax=Paracoccus saliphilus TaxID=405559 RepID=A0AA46A6X8_9RHOB|nr:Nramp family divalent metal transporter [Paracoccus saliphilus]WCR03802.1 Nramp family divalent metal transporter [Paracoccus saliphilus]SIT04820.1 Mn2+ and Fe2+ transporters of the NRAMP family [Paracoccus saliphilus]